VKEAISYYYEGKDPKTGQLLQLPRTSLAEAIAYGLMRDLAKQGEPLEGKMYGILLVETPQQERKVLKAFSGLLEGKSEVEGWVPPITGRNIAREIEVETLALLEGLKQELLSLQYPEERASYLALSQDFQQQLETLNSLHTQRKEERDLERQNLVTSLTGESLTIALERLNQASRLDGLEKKRLKQERDQALAPLKQLIIEADRRIEVLKQQRKQLSRQLQSQLYQAYSLTNFWGESISLQRLMEGGQLPTGTGECCAPKLLHYAATHHLLPLTMAEFWWGPSLGNKQHGQFYGACQERCQPLMGFLLSGSTIKLQHLDPPQPQRGESGHPTPFLDPPQPQRGESRHPTPHTVHPTPFLGVKIVYQDQWLLVVDKPAGLLSVPGRYRHTQDSVESRLRLLYDSEQFLKTVHRLDQDTSGLLVLAKDELTYRQMLKKFAQREVEKVYEALLDGLLLVKQGVIELPLWSDPADRPYQKVHWQLGKPSITRFQVIAEEENQTRVEFFPLTGRTHQLRVHAAHAVGLATPILGDCLYGCPKETDRLYLHAKKLSFLHPKKQGEYLHLEAKTPF